MAILPIHIYGDSVLRQKARPVGEVTPVVRTLASDLVETMFDAPGIGLAAPQVGVALRMFVIDPDLGENEDGEHRAIVFIDPVLRDPTDEVVFVEEGCLSIPELRVDVERPEGITVDYTDVDGVRRSIEVDDLIARVIQHEYDHLDGILFVDRINPIRRRLLSKQLKQMARSQKRARAVA